MKNQTISFARQFGPGAEGKDVRAAKRALTRSGEKGMADNGIFGAQAQKCLGDFKHKHGLLSDPIYTIEAHHKLLPFYDELAASWMNAAASAIREKELREAFVENRRWMYWHRGLFTYAEIRPYPLVQKGHPVHTDCSGSVELAAYWTPGCPDPSRMGFNGYGNTGTLLAGCTHIEAKNALPGDLIVYRKGPMDFYGHHVTSIDKVLGKGEFQEVSHGHQGDPGFYLHSVMAANQRDRYGAYLATFLRFL